MSSRKEVIKALTAAVNKLSATEASLYEDAEAFAMNSAKEIADQLVDEERFSTYGGYEHRTRLKDSQAGGYSSLVNTIEDVKAAGKQFVAEFKKVLTKNLIITIRVIQENINNIMNTSSIFLLKRI